MAVEVKINVFGEATDHAIGFRERRAAFEDQAGYPVAK